MSGNLIISVDAMGGDDAPGIVVEGVAHFFANDTDAAKTHILLHGDKAVLASMIEKSGLDLDQITVKHTDQVVAMDAKISTALRRSKGTSMWNAIADVKSGEAHVAVSAGNTGALMAMSKLQLRMKAGVQRPAIAARWPQKGGGECVVLDAGANVGSDSAQLTEFAVLGEAYYRALHGVAKPTIGLLNNGSEDTKGTDVIRTAHDRLSESELGLNYVGFVEGTDISMGDVNVIVTDGFSGNIALKTAEGTAKLIGHMMKEAFTASPLAKLAALISKPVLDNITSQIDPRTFNGGVFLGLNALVIKSHGGTDHIGYANALTIAADLAQTNFMEEIERTLTALHDEDENIGFIQ